MNALRSQRPITLATSAMGTRFELLLYGPDAGLLRAAGEEAIDLIEDAHRRLSRFERGSVVAEINAAAGASAVRIDDEVFGLLERCEEYRVKSDGAFDVVFDSEKRPERKRGLSDETSDSCTLRDEPSLALGPPFMERSRLVLDPETRRVALPGGRFVDLGGVAKGFALDLANQSLREAGVFHALLHGGSSTIVAIGGPWPIELSRVDEAIAPVVMLRDRALSVSSQQGDRPGHVIDPRTGETANTSRWAACIGANAEQTDAWATALVVLGDRPGGTHKGLTTVLQTTEGITLASERRWSVVGPDAGMVSTCGRDGACP